MLSPLHPREESPDVVEARLVVAGAGLPGRCVLRVRERRREAPAAELAARRAAASEHVVGVVRELPPRRADGRELDAVLLTAADAGALEPMLHRDGGLRGGEAATVLLGVAAGVDALHRGGWARPALSGDGVVFAGDGCPALDRLDAVVPFSPEAAVADAEAYYAWGRQVCLRVADGSGMLLLAAIERGLRAGTWGAVEEAVLAAVPPEPVELGRIEASESEPVHPRSHVHGIERAVTAAMNLLDGEPVRTLTQACGAWLRRRPALAVAGAVPVAAALAVVVLLPTSPAESTPVSGPSTPRATVPAGPRAAVTASVPPASGARGAPASPATTPEPPPGTGAAAPAAALSGDQDAVTAAGALLQARHACFAAKSRGAECLAPLLDGEPSFVAQETQALGASGAAGARDYAGADLSLVESWGDAALVAVAPDARRTPHSEPASLLLVRGEAGWRLRAVFP
ncbi:hypothetical protein [Leifsonia xyli]|uniref:hypothetical protein n=1 Tax=Leifsonia xyli TaxID=1575 RepID=UPI003D677073